MTKSHFAKVRQVQRQLVLLLATTTLFTAGCSNMSSNAPSSGLAGQAVTLSGRIHGGNQPVSGATVTLYFAGSSFAHGATAAATTTSANDGFGSFTFVRGADGGTSSGNTFHCPSPVPSNGGPYMYVVARGGNTVNNGSGTVNNDAVFLAPFGRCGGLGSGTFVNMSEVVTAATVAAVHQYMDPSITPIESSIGADGIFISDLALSKSFDTVSNMVDLSTGFALANTTRTATGSGSAGVSISVTPEQAKINHVADILSSCINNAASGSSACATLYTNAAPSADPTTTSVPNSAAGAATDVLMAAYYIFTNPTNGNPTRLAALYGIPAAAGSPYMPRLTVPPTDWTIGIDYTSTSNCSDVSTPSALYLNRPYDLNLDLNGNVWFGNNQAGSGTLAGLSPTGMPVGCYTLPAGTNSNAIAGAQSSLVDVAGHVWVGSARSNDIYRYTYVGSSGTPTVITATTAAPVLSMTSDGYGDIFYATTAGNLYELVNGANLTTVPTAVQINTQTIGLATKIMMDTNNVIWAASSGSFVTGTAGSVQSTTPASLGAFTTTHYNLASGTYGVAATRVYGSNEPNGPGVYISSITNNGIAYLLSTGSLSNGAIVGGGLNSPAGVALDGAQNVWVANVTGVGPSEFSKGGTALSPSTGFSKQAVLAGQRSIAIDASGNVWLGREGVSTITEIVGAAVPVYQPFANGLAPAPQVRFQTIP